MLFLDFGFLALHLLHMEFPRIRVKLELQLLAYATDTEIWDSSYNCDLHHSSQQYQILNPLNEVRDQTHTLMYTSQVHKLLSHNGNSPVFAF